jgi:hypothetical protein
MKDFFIDATERTPAVRFRAESCELSLEGESYPEDVAAFYGDVIPVLESWSESDAECIHVLVRLIYINSSSMKALYRIFDILDNGRELGKTVSIRWCYLVDDDVMQELGEDFKDRFPDLDLFLEAVE